MATRYWVGGTGNWDASTTTNWAATSGGASGSSVPTSADNVFFDGNSNATAYTVTLGAFVSCLDINSASPGTSGSFTMAHGSKGVLVYGAVSLLGNTIVTGSTGTFGLRSTSAVNIDFNNLNLGNVIIRTLAVGPFNIVNSYTNTNATRIDTGTFNTNNYTINTALLIIDGSGVSVTNLGSSTINVTNAGTCVQITTSANVTINAGTSTIKFTDTSLASITFTGGSYTFNNVWFARGTSTSSIIIAGSNTYNNFKDSGTAAHSILFTAGTTHTVTTFTVVGSVGNVITINSDTTATHALVKSGGGTISCDYLNIQHSVATPSTTWYAGVNSVNNQAVATAGSGWIFTAPPITRSIIGISSMQGMSSITF